MAFFDKVGATLSSVGSNVTNKTKGMVEVSNLNSQLRSCESQLRGYYEQIGKIYYEKCNGLTEDQDLMQAFMKIKEANEAIDHIQLSLKKAKGVVTCPGCGAEMPNGTVFCSSCGSKIGENVVHIAPQGEAKVCNACGATNMADAAFCATCGGKL